MVERDGGDVELEAEIFRGVVGSEGEFGAGADGSSEAKISLDGGIGGGVGIACADGCEAGMGRT